MNIQLESETEISLCAICKRLQISTLWVLILGVIKIKLFKFYGSKARCYNVSVESTCYNVTIFRWLYVLLSLWQAFPGFQDFDVQHYYLSSPSRKTQARIRRRGQNGNCLKNTKNTISFLRRNWDELSEENIWISKPPHFMYRKIFEFFNFIAKSNFEVDIFRNFANTSDKIIVY